MRLCQGTVAIVDTNAISFTRIWCCYEMYCTLEDKADKLFDISTATPSSNSAVVLTDGLTTQDKLEGKEPHWEHRGKAF
eukprot:2948193-Amphidinium_carterae.1